MLRPSFFSSSCGFVLVVLCCWLVTQSVGQTYVDGTSSCSSGCGSASKPWPTIAQALNTVSTGGQVIVNPGIYTGPSNSNFTLSNAYITISSATNDPTNTIIDCQHNGYAFVLTSGTFTIEGFTVRNCLNGNGGAFQISSTFTVFKSMILSDNSATNNGGGIWISSNTIKMYNSTISGSSSGNFGGGVYIANANLQLFNSTMVTNTAAHAGPSVYCVSASINIDTNSQILGLENVECHQCSITYINGGPNICAGAITKSFLIDAWYLLRSLLR